MTSTEPLDTDRLTADIDERTESSDSVERKDSGLGGATTSEQVNTEAYRSLVDGDQSLTMDTPMDSLPPTPMTPKRSVALADPSSDWMEHVDPSEDLKLNREGTGNKARFCDSSFRVPFLKQLSTNFER